MILRLATAALALAACRRSDTIPTLDPDCRAGITKSGVSAKLNDVGTEAPAMAFLENDLSLETEGGGATTLIYRCTRLPIEYTQTFSTAADNQTDVELVVVSGDAPRARGGKLLGMFDLEGIRPAPRGVPKIEVRFRVEKNGVLQVTAKDRDTGAAQNVSIKLAGKMSPDDGWPEEFRKMPSPQP
jgi:molecular chaperone DnaK (HSP70)